MSPLLQPRSSKHVQLGAQPVSRELSEAVDGAIGEMQAKLKVMIAHIEKQPGYYQNRFMRQTVNRLYSSFDQLNRVETDKW